MGSDLVDRGDMSAEIDLLRRLISESEGSPALQRSLTETLSHVVMAQDRRNVLASKVLSRAAVNTFLEQYGKALSQAMNLIPDEPLRWEVIAALDNVPKLEDLRNSRQDVTALLGRQDR